MKCETMPWDYLETMLEYYLETMIEDYLETMLEEYYKINYQLQLPTWALFLSGGKVDLNI